MPNARRFLETVRHLKGRQVVGQLVHRARRAAENPERWASKLNAPTWPGTRIAALTGLTSPVPTQPVDHILRGHLRFAGETHDVGWPFDWKAPDASKLWQYNLHYHDWLWSLREAGDSEKAADGVRAWMTSCPPTKRTVAWDPYPISLRLQNWLLLLLLPGDAPITRDELWPSFWLQARRLESRLEHHLLGNHLLENAVTLGMLGAALNGPDADRWKQTGLRLLRREIPEQMLPDGLHYELSPMYHGRILWLLEILARLNDTEITPIIQEPLERARQAHALLTHPDGGIALLNDAGLGIYTSDVAPAAPGPFALPDAGYFGHRTNNGDYIVCDAGPLGPDHIPGHAHADCLSFELSIGGQRVITDTGVSDYRVSPTRAWTRSTAAHNTVEIDGQDQAEMWGAFRVGRRGTIRNRTWTPKHDGFTLTAEHDGYHRLPCKATHRRTFRYTPGSLVIEDEVQATKPCRTVARLHFAPGCRITGEGNERTIERPGGRATLRTTGPGKLTVTETPYYEQFGEEARRPALEYTVDVGRHASWQLNLAW